MAKLPPEIIDLFNGLVRDLYGPGDGPLIVVSGGIEGAPLCAVVGIPAGACGAAKPCLARTRTASMSAFQGRRHRTAGASACGAGSL
jgi:hypothetical protein